MEEIIRLNEENARLIGQYGGLERLYREVREDNIQLKATIDNLREQVRRSVAYGNECESELARLKSFASGRGMVSEASDMSEVAVLVCGLHDEIARLAKKLEVAIESRDYYASLQHEQEEELSRLCEQVEKYQKVLHEWHMMWIADLIAPNPNGNVCNGIDEGVETS